VSAAGGHLRSNETDSPDRQACGTQMPVEQMHEAPVHAAHFPDSQSA